MIKAIFSPVLFRDGGSRTFQLFSLRARLRSSCKFLRANEICTTHTVPTIHASMCAHNKCVYEHSLKHPSGTYYVSQPVQELHTHTHMQTRVKLSTYNRRDNKQRLNRSVDNVEQPNLRIKRCGSLVADVIKNTVAACKSSFCKFNPARGVSLVITTCKYVIQCEGARATGNKRRRRNNLCVGHKARAHAHWRVFKNNISSHRWLRLNQERTRAAKKRGNFSHTLVCDARFPRFELETRTIPCNVRGASSLQLTIRALHRAAGEVEENLIARLDART